MCVRVCGKGREEVGGGSSWNGKLVHGVFLLDDHARARESVCVAAATVLKKRESLFACVRGRVYRGACVSDLPWWRVESGRSTSFAFAEGVCFACGERERDL